MLTEIEKINAILKQKLSEEEARSIMSELTIASDNGSIAISGDAAGSINITGNQNTVGNNNNTNYISINISSGTDSEILITSLHEVLKNLQPAEENEISKELFRQEIENIFYQDYSENRQIDLENIESFKEIDRQRTEPLGTDEILIIAQNIIQNYQEKENTINEYKEFVKQQFLKNNYKIDNSIRRKISNRRAALKLEEETVILLYQEIGEDLYTQDLLEESISVLTEALGIMQNPEIYYGLGLAFYKQEKQDIAIRNFMQAQALFRERGQHHEAEEIAIFLNKFHIK